MGVGFKARALWPDRRCRPLELGATLQQEAKVPAGRSALLNLDLLLRGSACMGQGPPVTQEPGDIPETLTSTSS